MTCLGATLLPIGLFIFAWTSPPPIHYIVPILSSVPFGTGFLLIFTGVQVYIVDSYGVYAASALAANAVQRGVLATVFPLFSVRLYEKLGLQWAGTCEFKCGAWFSLAVRRSPFAVRSCVRSVLLVRDVPVVIDPLAFFFCR
jgi:hypothetical protein